MLFNYELKKIWRRVSPLLVLVVLLVTTIATVAFTALLFNHTPAETPDVSQDYTALQTKINDWRVTDRASFSKAFENFYQDYKTMNASTFNGIGLVNNYHKTQQSFRAFHADYYQRYIDCERNNITDYLLVQKKYLKNFGKIMDRLADFFDADYNNGAAIVNGLQSTNSAWDDASLQNILDNLFYVQTISVNDLDELKAFFTKHPAEQVGYDYNDAYDYALNRFWLAVATTSTYSGDLSQYEGFDDYQGVAASTQACKLANYRLEHAADDFGTPFAFGNIFNNTRQVSLFDFVFTNLEMAMIPVALLVMIWAACAFFTDNYQSTLITPIAAGKKRSTIILTKMAVVMLLTVVSLLLLTAVYLTCGLIFFRAYLSPDILFLFNGTTPMVMSAINYFMLYILNLVFKFLPLIALCGLFSFTKTKPFVIIGFTTLICVVVVALNFFLGGLWFYQFVPLLGLDPIRYFGAELLLAPMPSTYNILFTFPVMLVITVILYWVLIRKFRSHDF